MHWLRCSLLVTTLCSAYCQDSVAQAELTNNTVKNSSLEASKGIDKNIKSPDSTECEPLFTIKIIRDSTTNLNEDVRDAQNFTGESKEANITALNSEVQLNLNSEQQREVTNVTFNDIKPLLLFPILPFLFPPRKTENETSENQITPQDNKVKVEGNPSDVKPFIFFDFAFIRRIPLNDRSNNTNDSNLINVEKLGISKVEDSKKNFQKSRRRRNTNIKLETPVYFDESPLFPDSELDEFLPKSDLFFPDLPFHHHKSLKKLSRRKRDQKKSDLKSDLNFFFDAFDEAFMRTKKELERTDPLLNFLRGGQPSFDDNKKENIFEQIPNIQEKPKMKWRIQRNIKRFKNDHQDKLRKGQDGPMIIVDKVVKIGEFHVNNEGHDKDKLKKKKRENELKKKLTGVEMTSFEKDEPLPKNIFDIFKREVKIKKRSHPAKSEEQSDTNVRSKEIEVLPEITSSNIAVAPNTTSGVKKRESGITPQDNKTTKNFKYGSLMKMIDTLKAKIKQELTNEANPTVENQKQKGSTYYEKLSSKKSSYENLKRNITELLNQFLDLSENSENANLGERPEHNEHDETGIFDWTEKETQNTLGRSSREKRQKKDTDFVDEYVDLSKKEKQIADLNYLFLTVTLPTVFVFALVLLVCFFSLQVKGKICTKLFRPRQVYIVEDEKLMQFKKSTPQTSPKLQTFLTQSRNY